MIIAFELFQPVYSQKKFRKQFRTLSVHFRTVYLIVHAETIVQQLFGCWHMD